MNTKRIVRDVLVLLGFCGAFLVLVLLFGNLDASDADDMVDFSASRLKADQSKKKKDWESAKTSLKTLIDRDPFDGRAQFEYASTLYKQRSNLIDKLDELAEAGDTESAEVIKLRADLAKYNESSILELSKAKQFARYRGRSLVFLAVVEVERGEFDSSLDYLELFVDAGNYTYDGLESPQSRVFGQGGIPMTDPGAKIVDATRLHSYSRFWDIVRREGLNRLRQ